MTETETVSTIDDLAFLLSDNPAMIDQIMPQRLIHALLPDTASKNRIMPRNSSYADLWMIKHGNPLRSVDAALALLKEVYPAHMFTIHDESKDACTVKLNVSYGGGLRGQEAKAATIPGAIIIALLEHVAVDRKGAVA